MGALIVKDESLLESRVQCQRGSASREQRHVFGLDTSSSFLFRSSASVDLISRHIRSSFRVPQAERAAQPPSATKSRSAQWTQEHGDLFFALAEREACTRDTSSRLCVRSTVPSSGCRRRKDGRDRRRNVKHREWKNVPRVEIPSSLPALLRPPKDSQL